MWVLYSMIVLAGRFRTRLKVSLILDVVVWSLDVLFQIDRMSSWGHTMQGYEPLQIRPVYS